LERDLSDERCRSFRLHQGIARHLAPQNFDANTPDPRHLDNATVGVTHLALAFERQTDLAYDVRWQYEHGRARVYERFDLDGSNLFFGQKAAPAFIAEFYACHDSSHSGGSVSSIGRSRPPVAPSLLGWNRRASPGVMRACACRAASPRV